MLEYFNTISGQFYAIGALAILDLVLGLALALINKEFEWERLTDYLQSNFLPILGWLGIEYVLYLSPELPLGIDEVALAGVYGTISLKILASVLGHLSKMGILTDILSKAGIGK